MHHRDAAVHVGNYWKIRTLMPCFLDIVIVMHGDVAGIDKWVDNLGPSLVLFLLQAVDLGQLGFEIWSGASAAGVLLDCVSNAV